MVALPGAGRAARYPWLDLTAACGMKAHFWTARRGHKRSKG